MRKFKSFLLLLFISLIWGGGGLPVARGCAEAPGYFDNETIFFLSTLAQEPLLKRFYFDAVHRRSKYDWDEEILTRRAGENIKEWQKFLGPDLQPEEIKQLIYKTSLKDLARLTAPDSELKEAGRLGTLLRRAELRPVVAYLIFAKQAEPYCVVDRWSWDREEEAAGRRNPEAMRRLINRGKSLYAKTNSIFLKQRYAYQIVRLAHYCKDYQACIDLYDRYLSPLPRTSVVGDWGQRHKIGAMLALGKTAEALVMTSLMFDRNSRMMDEAYLDYRTPAEGVWAESLRIARHPHRQATLWMLRGLKEPRFILEPLQKMAELEPRSPRLEVMLVRYLNRMECELFNSAYFFETKKPELLEERQNGLKHLRELKDYIAATDKTKFRQPALWYTVNGYLSIMERQYNEARNYLARAEALAESKNFALRQQIKLLKLLNTIVEQPKVTREIENDAPATLRWLDAYQGRQDNLQEIHNAFYTLLGQKYLMNKEFPKAYCCLAKAGSYGNDLLELYPSTARMDQLLAFLAKSGKSRFEELITAGLPYSGDDYLSVAGTQLLRKARYQEAVLRFQKISRQYWVKLRKEDLDLVATSFEENCYNPRTGLYKYPRTGFKKYTKLEFTRKIIDLEKKAVKEPNQAAVYYYQIGNGFFHSPFWGFNRQIWAWPSAVWYGGEWYPFNVQGFGGILKNRYAIFETEYGKRKLALYYYVKAMNAAKDRELAAKCCFLAAACMTKFSHYDEFQEPGKGKNYYFNIFQKKYSRTGYYQKVVQECATLKDYLGKLKE